MKIAFFTDTFLPQVNGIATSLANQAQELGERGHEVLIFAPKDDDIKRKTFKAENVTMVNLPAVPAMLYTEFKIGVFGLPKVVKYLTKFDPDVIHLHTAFTVGMDAVVASKIFKKPLVGTVHTFISDSDYLRVLKYRLAVKLLDKVSQRFLNFLFGQCDIVVAPSKMLVQELNSNGFKKTVSYLPNGIILNQPKMLSNKAKGALRKKYGLRQKVVLHFGRLSYEKNVDVLIKAFFLIAHKHSDVSLLIIGDGPATKSLKKLTVKLGLEDRVIFTGFIDHEVLISSGIISIGDLFATASTMEVQPMAILEAMLFGLPIIGIKQAGLIELVSSNGFLVKPGSTRELAEKMKKILYDPPAAARMKEASLRLIKLHSIDKTINTLEKLYQNLISNFTDS